MIDYDKAEAEARKRALDEICTERLIDAMDRYATAAKAAEHVAVCPERGPMIGKAPRGLPGPRCGHGWECPRLRELTKEAT